LGSNFQMVEVETRWLELRDSRYLSIVQFTLQRKEGSEGLSLKLVNNSLVHFVGMPWYQFQQKIR